MAYSPRGSGLSRYLKARRAQGSATETEMPIALRRLDDRVAGRRRGRRGRQRAQHAATSTQSAVRPDHGALGPSLYQADSFPGWPSSFVAQNPADAGVNVTIRYFGESGSGSNALVGVATVLAMSRCSGDWMFDDEAFAGR